jgi:hypothetical protein
VSSSTRLTTAVETALIAGGFVVLFALLPHALFSTDDRTRFDDIEQLLQHGHLTGSHFSLVMPLASAPFLLLGKVLGSPEWWAARFNVIVVAVGTLVVFRLVRGRADLSLVRIAVLVLCFASFLTSALRGYGAETFSATMVAVGIVALVTGRRVGGWAAMVIGVVNTPPALIGLSLIACAELLRTKRLRCLAPLVAAAALIMLESWVRRGGPLVTGYHGDHGVKTILPYSGRPGFSYPLLFGIASILFSFGRGLLFYMPGLLLWFGVETRRLAQSCRSTIVSTLLFVAGLVLVYAKWWAWYGGFSWGPRFFTVAAIPASLLLAVRLQRPSASIRSAGITVVVLAASAWVSIAGAVADLNWFATFCNQNDYSLESICWYTPEFSGVGRPLVQFPALTVSTAVVVGYCALVFAYLAARPCITLVRASTSLRPALARTRPVSHSRASRRP